MKPLVNRHAFEAIGTQWSIETDTPLTTDELAEIQQTISDFDRTYSRFLPDSLVTRAAHESPGVFMFPPSIVPLYQTYLQLALVTHGAVNPLVGKSLEQHGYDANYSLQPTSHTPYIPPLFSETIELHDTSLTLHEPVLLDIGAIGKGYLADQLAHTVSQHHDEYVVDASGDVFVHRSQAETIGLEDPRDPTRIIGTIRLTEGSLCASAINRRAWGSGLHHVIDARTGFPSDSPIIATWAVAATTMLADALTTALFFTLPTELQKSFGDFFYVTMKRDGSVDHNIQSIGELYT